MPEASKRPSAPSKLGPAGRSLWHRVTKQLELDANELMHLGLACRQLDDVARLERALAHGEAFTVGSTGQSRLSPVFAELRQSRLAVGSHLARIAVPDDEDDDRARATPSSRRAQHAAESRWLRVAKSG